MLTVIALGGNALMQPGERGTAAEQRANLAATFRAIAPLLRDGQPFVITHGNGPQVGNELLRQELASAEAPPRGRDANLLQAVDLGQAGLAQGRYGSGDTSGE